MAKGSGVESLDDFQRYFKEQWIEKQSCGCLIKATRTTDDATDGGRSHEVLDAMFSFPVSLAWFDGDWDLDV